MMADVVPYLDLFSRTERAGWTVFGDQTNMFEAVS